MMDFNKKYDQSQSKKATKGASNPVSFQEARDPFGHTEGHDSIALHLSVLSLRF